MKSKFPYLVLFGLLVTNNFAFATDDENLELIPRSSQDRSYRAPLEPAEIYNRTLAVLKHYDAPVQPTGQDELSKLNGSQSSANIKKLLKFFDFHKTFEKLFTLTSTELNGFEDYQGKTKQTLNIKLSPNANADDLRLRLAQFSTSSEPLRGLRVAIDPGHMGSEKWDKMTGKFVYDGKGNYLSEGLLALQTSLLLQTELKKLGASVKLTRGDLRPVTNMNMDALPIPTFAKNELLEHSYSPWFLKLLSTGTGNTLFKAFEQSPERKKLWSENSRYNYFILKEDLWARADRINKFDPDIVLIVHYDIASSSGDGHGLNPKAPNQAKIFVTGAYFDIEFGSRKARKQFAKKLLNQQQWDESIQLSRNILAQFKSQMGLQLPKGFANSITVEPGIFARNLTLPRFLDAPAIAYLECLFYNRPQEFYALLDTKYPMIINGVNYPYSDRLVQVVNSLKQGILDYAASY